MCVCVHLYVFHMHKLVPSHRLREHYANLWRFLFTTSSPMILCSTNPVPFQPARTPPWNLQALLGSSLQTVSKREFNKLKGSSHLLGFPCGSVGKDTACNEGDLGSTPGLGRSPGEGKGYRLQYSGLENSIQSMGSQRIRHHWVTFTFTFSFVCLLPWITVLQWPVIQSQKTSFIYVPQFSSYLQQDHSNKLQVFGFHSWKLWF